METVRLTVLICEKQQETGLLPFPADEVRLDIQIDDGPWREGVWSFQGIRTGQEELLGLAWEMERHIRFRLMEEDIGPDDLLGQRIVHADWAPKKGQLRFARQGGEYRILYIWD